jgi:hypothetical protein
LKLQWTIPREHLLEIKSAFETLIPKIKAHTQVDNLALNPSFEEDEVVLNDPEWSQWWTWAWEDGANSTVKIDETESIDGARSLLIEPKGFENWYFIVANSPIPVEVGKDYTASFWAKAAEPRPLAVRYKATDYSSDSWGDTDFQLTTEWAEYSFTADALSAGVKLEFMCAGVEVPFWLDSVSVYKATPAD